MNDRDPLLAHRIGELKESFDRSFAVPPEGTALDEERLLAISTGGSSWALRANDISELQAIRPIVPLPTGTDGLLGVSCYRRVLFAVYDLAALLGGSLANSPRWILLRKSEQVGFVFEQLEGYWNIPSQTIVKGTNTKGAPPDEVVTLGESSRPLLSLSTLIHRIEHQLGSTHGKEVR